MLQASLRLARQWARITQDQVASALGLRRATVSGWERDAEPGAGNLVRLADLYGLTLDQLTGRAPLPLASAAPATAPTPTPAPAAPPRLPSPRQARKDQRHRLAAEERETKRRAAEAKRAEKAARLTKIIRGR